MDETYHNPKRKLDEEKDAAEGAAVKRPKAREEEDEVNLLHLSDDVLLCILKHCLPHHLRAVSFCCRRLSRLCRDRALWRHVDLRARRLGECALHKYVRAMPPRTTQALCIRGLVGRPRNEEGEEDKPPEEPMHSDSSYVVTSDGSTFCDITVNHRIVLDAAGHSAQAGAESSSTKEGGGNASPRPYGAPPSPPAPPPRGPPSAAPAPAPDPDLTVTREMMLTIRRKCPALRELRLEYCYIDCSIIQPSVFPPTLESLSLRGCVCRNVPLSRSYLFRIQDYCPLLAELDLSCCGWLASHSLLVLSKMPRLRRLALRSCWGLGECVAYASLSARYGFRTLQVLDIRGTPMGDSEVSAFSLMGALQELYLQAAGGAVADGGAPLEDPLDGGRPQSWEAEDPLDLEDEDEEDFEDVAVEEIQDPDQDLEGELPPRPPPRAAPVENADENNEQGIPNRVHVIYVDVRRARNDAMRVLYAPGAQRAEQHAPAAGDDGPPQGEARAEEAEAEQPLNVRVRFGADGGAAYAGGPGGAGAAAPERPPGAADDADYFMHIRRDQGPARNINIEVQIGEEHNGEQDGPIPPPGPPAPPLIPDGDMFRRGMFNVQVFRGVEAPPGQLAAGRWHPDNILAIMRRDLHRQPWPFARPQSELARLVSDAALLRLGAAAASPLRALVCRGYPRVTDRALAHLAAAAPQLATLDVSHTGVTAAGARAFRATRPDCALLCEHLT